MPFRWWTNRRRRKLLAQPPPADWLGWLRDDLPFFNRLTASDQADLFDLARIFVNEKTFIPRDGFELTDRIQLNIAAQACLLIFRMKHRHYRRVQTIFVYPTTRTMTTHDGRLERDTAFTGAASPGGPVLLCWDAVQRGAAHHNDGHNVVFHEFAHALDFNDRTADGCPPLASRNQYQQWFEVMSRHYDDLLNPQGRSRRVIRDYGKTSPAEFFACATEALFEQPRQLRRHLPDLYALLRDDYHQHPAAWPGG
ncbi:MAG: M90 family metallopeptidase [Planctomycetota bacterium]